MRWNALFVLASLALLAGAATTFGFPGDALRVRAAEPLPTARPFAGEGEGLCAALPDGTVLAFEGPGLAALLGAGEDAFVVRALASSPTVTAMLDAGEATPTELLERGEDVVGAPLLPTLRTAFAHGVALGLSIRGDSIGWTLVARSDDAAALAEHIQHVLDFAAEEAGFPNAFRRPHEEVEGADAWFVGEELCVARDGTALVVAQRRADLRDALRGLRRLGTGAPAPANAPVLRAWLNADAWLRAGERVPELGGADGLVNLREEASQPAMQFLLGPGLSYLGTGETISAELTLSDEDLRLAIESRGVEAGAFAALFPGERARAFAVPPTPGFEGGAELLLHRDLDGIFEHRADLFPPEVLPAFAKSISDLSPFLGGLDLTEEVLPGLGPWMRVVAQPVAFAERVRPAQPLPAACLLLELDDPERLGGALVAGFQSAVSIVNIERAQQAQVPLVLGVELVGETEVSKARYLPPREGEGVDIEYNLEPACAVVGSTFVLGTHRDLVAQVVERLEEGAPASSAVRSGTDALRLDARLLAKALEENRAALVMNQVLEEGASRAEARSDMDAIAGLLALLHGVRVDVDCPEPGRVRLEAELDLVKPRGGAW